MTDLATLEQTILTDIAAAGDEAGLEAVRVAALNAVTYAASAALAFSAIA